MSTVNILDTKNYYGNMNTVARFYPSSLPASYRKEDFLKRRLILGEEKGFDGHKMFMADQKDKNGTYRIMNDCEILTAKDGWDVSIKEDILVTTDKEPGIVVGHPVADCPVVIINDCENNVTAVCHCSGELVDKKLPLLHLKHYIKQKKS